MSATYPKRKAIIGSAAELDAYIEELLRERRRKGDLPPPHDAQLYEALKMNTMGRPDQLLSGSALRYHDRNNGQTALHVAAKKGIIAVFQQEISHKRLDNCDHHGRTPLFMAAQHGHHAIVDQLIRLNADLEIPASKCKTPMYAAAKKNHLKVVALLVESRVDVNARAKNGQTPLMAAAKYGHRAMITRLMLSGADESAEDGFNRTALSIAVSYGHVGVVEELLKMGSDVNTCDRLGRTPLRIALQRHDDTCVTLLMKHDAKIDGDDPNERIVNAVFSSFETQKEFQ